MDRWRKNNIIIMAVTAALCLINKTIRTEIPVQWLRWFMCCYFNDMVGAVTFASYCSIVFSFRNFAMKKLWQIELLLFCCGLFWEFITPIYRKDTVTDLWDIAAYMLGGILYWIITVKDYKYINADK